MPQVGTKFGRWLDLTFMQLSSMSAAIGCSAMNQSLTLAFLVAAGIGLVVQNTLMVRITQSSSTILIAMLLNSLVGIVLFVSMLLVKNGMAGFNELASTVRWWTLIPGLLGSFLSLPVMQRISEWGAATMHRRTGGKPADWRSGDGHPQRATAFPCARWLARSAAQ